MVQLRWLRTNALCLVAMAISGLLTVQPPHQNDLPSVEQLRSTPQTPRIAFFLPMEITNRVFTDALLNPASEEYQTLYKEVSDLLKSIYDCPDYNTCPTDVFYGGVTTMTFSSGSVIATPTVVFNTYFINPSIIHFFFITKANSVQPQTLQLNLDFTTKDKITLATTTTTPPTPATTTTSTTKTPTTTSTVTPTTKSATTSPTTPATSTAPTTPSSATTTTPDPTTSSTNAKTSSDHRAAVSATKTIPGNRSSSYVTNRRKKLAVKATTVDLHNKHTNSTGKANDPRTPGDIKSNESCDWIPGWGTALLVLAAAILFLLIIIFIMMLVQWCCKKTENGHTDTIEDSCYFEKKQLPQDPLPAYTPPAPVMQGPWSAPVTAGDEPRKNRFGFYAVNP